MANCLYCGKELVPFPGQTKIKKDRKYCNHLCGCKYNSEKRNKRLRDNPEFKEYAKGKFKAWYEANKDRQKNNIMNDYRKNKPIWNERNFTSRHRDKIKKYINSYCPCGNETRIIFHNHYGNAPALRTGTDAEKDALIKKYTEENLIGVCSRTCLRKEKRKQENSPLTNPELDSVSRNDGGTKKLVSVVLPSVKTPSENVLPVVQTSSEEQEQRMQLTDLKLEPVRKHLFNFKRKQEQQ